MEQSDWDNVKPMEIPEEAMRQSLEGEQTFTEKLSAFVHRSPFLVAGMVSFTGVCGYGIYKWNTTKYAKPSLFIIQMRVAAQSAVIGCISLGMLYNMYKERVLGQKK